MKAKIYVVWQFLSMFTAGLQNPLYEIGGVQITTRVTHNALTFIVNYNPFLSPNFGNSWCNNGHQLFIDLKRSIQQLLKTSVQCMSPRVTFESSRWPSKQPLTHIKMSWKTNGHSTSQSRQLISIELDCTAISPSSSGTNCQSTQQELIPANFVQNTNFSLCTTLVIISKLFFLVWIFCSVH